jgi:hypothetical protein
MKNTEQQQLVHAILLVLAGHKSPLCVNALLHALLHIIKECAPTKADQTDALNEKKYATQ